MRRRDLFGLALAAGAAGVLGSVSAEKAVAASLAQTGRPDHVTTPDGTRLFVRDWGTGAPVLFLAGWTLPSDFWAYQMMALASSGYRAIAYDRRGHGRSSDPGRGYDHDHLADDLKAVIDSLGLENVTLVAHSMGGTEIARYFARHGGKGVGKVVMVGTITPFLMQTGDNAMGLPREVLASLRAPIVRDFPGWIEANAKPFFVPETSRDMIEWGKALMLQTSLYAALELARENAETDFRADLAKVNVPTLVIHGDKDASAPLVMTGAVSAKLMPNATLKVYEGAPHGLPLTHIEKLNADLRAFIAG
ncbi:alpha/beta fold hydrolase [Kordiimonas gwangyangensis]|uniref:alpha/beta fold hydrolase n=1 Tax=Kordiimonas gwangyangensis TaxID=288022 RepID=UPI00039E668B|nr:alpha/beta hydrolase [Kordiimonas gwangyangensis]